MVCYVNKIKEIQEKEKEIICRGKRVFNLFIRLQKRKIHKIKYGKQNFNLSTF